MCHLHERGAPGIQHVGSGPAEDYLCPKPPGPQCGPRQAGFVWCQFCAVEEISTLQTEFEFLAICVCVFSVLEGSTF